MNNGWINEWMNKGMNKPSSPGSHIVWFLLNGPCYCSVILLAIADFYHPPTATSQGINPEALVNPWIHENIYNIHFSEHDICIGRGVHQFLKLLSLLPASSLNVFRFLVSSGIWPKCTSNHTPPCGLLWSTGQGCSPSPGWVAATCHLTLIFHLSVLVFVQQYLLSASEDPDPVLGTEDSGVKRKNTQFHLMELTV